MKRPTSLTVAAVVAMIVSLTIPAGAADEAPSPREATPPPHADADGDGLSRALEVRLDRAGAQEPMEVIVSWDGRPDVAAARAAAGPFAVLQQFTIIDAFVATVTPGQARALARVQGVSRVDENFEVLATNEETDQDYGTERARIEFGFDGSGINVCVIDTGADPNHEQLDSQIRGFFDAINGRTDPYDDQGHGTHVAATIGGDGEGGSSNAARYQGIAPGAGLYIAKVLSSSGSGTAQQIINGIEWCVAQPGVRVMSASLGTASGSDGHDPLSEAVNNAVQNHGVVATIAAGNSGDGPESVGSPGAAEHALTVGAVSKFGAGLHLAAFSSRGPNLAGILKPEVVSPGVAVVSADAGTTSGYVAASGTSMATPFTAGAVALALDADPSLTPSAVKNLVASTARDAGDPGADNNWGHGLIDGYRLVSAALGGSATGSLPAHQLLSDSVPNNGLSSHPIEISGDDIGQPLGITILINGQLDCSLFFFGVCFAYEWSPDLDARLIAPDGAITDSRCPLEGNCGAVGVQETFNVGSALAGIYTLEIYPYDGSPNNGQGGSFEIDVFTGSSGAAPPPTNISPTADAGPDQTVADSDGVDGESVTLNGSASSDSDGTILAYSWTEDGVEIANAVSPTVDLGDGTHTITLTVTDDLGATGSDEVLITVEAPTAPNAPPNADAGPDQTVADSDGAGGESVALDGSASSDSDGSIVSYSWTEGGVEIASAATPTVDLADGPHTITLTVTDDDGAIDTDTVTITVTGPPSDPGSVHVHDLDDLSQKLAKGAWKGVVNVVVRDSTEDSVTGFTVTGTFSQNGWSASYTCIDGGSSDADGLVNGVCRFDSGQFPSNNGNASFTVMSVTVDGYTYDNSSNHDPDGDSDGTTIQLSK